jgi:hypothetical protein
MLGKISQVFGHVKLVVVLNKRRVHPEETSILGALDLKQDLVVLLLADTCGKELLSQGSMLCLQFSA